MEALQIRLNAVPVGELVLEDPANDIEGRGGFVSPVLRILFKVRLEHRWAQKYSLAVLGLYGQAVLEDNSLLGRLYLGYAPHFVEGGHVANCETFLDLTSHKIRHIETVRSGAALNLKLNLHAFVGTVEGPGRHSIAEFYDAYLGDMPISVPQSVWIDKMLPQLGWGSSMVVELPVPVIDEGGIFVQAVGRIDQAREQLAMGYTKQAIALCRDALSDASKALGYGDIKKETVAKLLECFTTEDIKATDYIDVVMGLKSILDRAHHSLIEKGESIERRIFTSYEADYVIRVTASTISLLAKLNRDLESK